MAKCLGCGKEVPDGASFCPYCGKQVSEDVKFSPYCGHNLKTINGSTQKPAQIYSTIGGIFAAISLFVPIYLTSFSINFFMDINYKLNAAVWFLFSYISSAQYSHFLIYYYAPYTIGFTAVVVGTLLMLFDRSYSGKIGGALVLFGVISASIGMIYGASTVATQLGISVFGVQAMKITNYQYFPVGMIFAFIGGSLGIISMPKT